MTKISVIKIYARTISKIQAEESLRRVQEMAVANGSLKKGNRQAILNGWAREARGRHKRVRRKKKISPEEMQANLAGMGIGVEWRKH